MRLSKVAEKTVQRTRPSNKHSPQKVQKLDNPYIEKIGVHKFNSGDEVGIFEISDYRALNQFIGYAKFLNTDYGDVFYRGEVNIHETLLPSVSRHPKNKKYEEELSHVVQAAIKDPKFASFAKLSGFRNQTNSSLVMEAILQHYGFSTHFVDVVDNHWIALWFGLNKYCTIKNINEYSYYETRTVNPVDLFKSKSTGEMDVFQYMILIAVDNNAAPIERGIYFGNDVITIDLRSSLPSVFLRPHAQHGLVLRKNIHESNGSFDLSSNVIAIIRLRIDKVNSWIGSGGLLSNENLFPSPAYDWGYEVLLQREDLFRSKFQSIANYV